MSDMRQGGLKLQLQLQLQCVLQVTSWSCLRMHALMILE